MADYRMIFFNNLGAADRGEHRQAAGACRSWFKRRGQLPRPESSWFRLTRRPRGGVSQQFRYPRDPPPASSEYSPQSAQRS